MIHIVFQEPDVAVIQQAINLDESLWGEIVLVRDDYSLGPVNDLSVSDGISQRKQWWKNVFGGGEMEYKPAEGIKEDQQQIDELIENLQQNAEEVVWIWAAQNNQDVSGYYWLMSQLKVFQGRVFILYLNNLPFFNEKGSLFYPDRLATIPAREFLKAKKLARPITLSEFEVDPDEWKKLTEQDKPVRLLEGGKKLVQHGIEFYDSELQNYITGEWQKASRILHQFINKAKHTTGYVYLLWRLKTIAATEEYAVQGEMKSMKDFEVKRKTN